MELNYKVYIEFIMENRPSFKGVKGFRTPQNLLLQSFPCTPSVYLTEGAWRPRPIRQPLSQEFLRALSTAPE